ncbi:MAG: P-loop NTPase [Candidatus Scalindua sp.]|nr:P-loop NTPase [Candidatus Scalindua sp.]
MVAIEHDFTFMDFLTVIYKHKYKILVIFLSIVTTVALYTFRMTPIYEAETRLIIKPGRENIYKPEVGDDNRSIITSDRTEMLNSEIEIITSRDLAEKAVTTIGLDTIYPDSINTNPADVNPLESAALRFQRDLSAERVKNSGIIKVSFQHCDPQIAARSVNLLVELFKEKHLQTFSNPKSTPFLEEKLETYRKILKESEGRLEAFKQEYKISSLDEQRNLLLEQRIEFDSSLKMAENRIGELRKKLTSMNIKTQINAEDVPLYTETEGSDIIDNARVRLFDLQQREKELTRQYKDHSRMVTDVRKEIRFVKDFLKEQEALKAMALLQSQEAISTEFKEQLKALDKEIQTLDLWEDGLRDLEREQIINENNYKIYIGKLEDARISDEMDRQKIASISVIEEAIIPNRPVKPRKKVNVALGIVVGALTALGLAFLFEQVDNSVRTPDDVRRRLGMAVLGMIPYDKSLKRSKTLALLQNETHNEKKKHAQGYYEYDFSANLVPGFPLMHSGMSGHVLLIESSTSGEGKSTVLARSALNLARGGLRVVMVDADVLRPSLHNMFSVNGVGEKGLIPAMTHVLSQKIQQGTLDEYSVNDLFSVIALKKESGKLTVKNDTHGMTAVFDKGCLFQLQSRDVPYHNRLGTMLLNGNFITESQLKDSLDRNQRTGQPLGYILLNAGYINQGQLQGPLKLQMEELLQKLFSWKQGAFTFEPGSIETCKDERIHFEEDYAPIISRLGRMGGSRLLEREVLSNIQSLDEPNLSLLPAGAVGVKPDGLSYFALLGKFLGILKQHFNVVLVDAPPILETMGSFKPLLSLVDGVIFVIKPGQVSIKNINEAVSCIKESETKIIGTVLNQTKKGQGYYYK